MPYYQFENENFEKINSILKTLNIILSSVATIKNENIAYDSIGGVALRFTKNGSFKIEVTDFISKNIDKASKHHCF